MRTTPRWQLWTVHAFGALSVAAGCTWLVIHKNRQADDAAAAFCSSIALSSRIEQVVPPQSLWSFDFSAIPLRVTGDDHHYYFHGFARHTAVCTVHTSCGLAVSTSVEKE